MINTTNANLQVESTQCMQPVADQLVFAMCRCVYVECLSFWTNSCTIVAALRKVLRKTTLTWRTCITKKIKRNRNRKKKLQFPCVCCVRHPPPAHLHVCTRCERTLLSRPARLPFFFMAIFIRGNIFRIMACYCFGNKLLLKSRIRRTFLKVCLHDATARRSAPVDSTVRSCTAFGAGSKDRHTPWPRIIQTCNWLIVSWDRHGRLCNFSVALNSSDHKWLQMFGEKGTKTLSYPHFHVPLSKQFFDHFHPFPYQCKCKAIQIESRPNLL